MAHVLIPKRLWEQSLDSTSRSTKDPFLSNNFVSFLFAYQKVRSQIVPSSFGRLGPDGEEQLYSSLRTFSFSEGDSNTYPNGAAWEWRARPESSSLEEIIKKQTFQFKSPNTRNTACRLWHKPGEVTASLHICRPPSTDESNGPSSPIPRTPPSGLLTQTLASFYKPGPAPMSPRKQHPRALRDSPEHAGSSHHCLSFLPLEPSPWCGPSTAAQLTPTFLHWLLLLGAPE